MTNKDILEITTQEITTHKKEHSLYILKIETKQTGPIQITNPKYIHISIEQETIKIFDTFSTKITTIPLSDPQLLEKTQQHTTNNNTTSRNDTIPNHRKTRTINTHTHTHTQTTPPDQPTIQPTLK